jgi:hypothetical protein
VSASGFQAGPEICENIPRLNKVLVWIYRQFLFDYFGLDIPAISVRLFWFGYNGSFCYFVLVEYTGSFCSIVLVWIYQQFMFDCFGLNIPAVSV